MSSILIEQRTKRTEGYLKDRFGMFIHWGLYAIPARGEWVRSVEQIPTEDYTQFFDEFNPADYNPKEWAKLAKQAGMKYAVLTAKHHDGFCLFDSKLTDYKSTNTKCKRDLVAEYLEAFRSEGIKVGLYYSLIDWHHPDFPHYGDMHHPMRNNEAFKNTKHNFDNYLEYMHGQVRELLTNYGKLDLMWFDFSYGDMSCEKWKATELVTMIREIQPHIIIDNRLEGSGEKSGTIKTQNPTIYAGDFTSPEQMIPPEGMVDDQGNPIPWEACITLNDNWGYCASDNHYKSPKMVIRGLVECVSKNGNCLINVGPDATGKIPSKSIEILQKVGEWMNLNSKSIYGCGKAFLDKPEFGRYTQNGNKLYLHIYDEVFGAVCLRGLAGKIEKVRLLKDGSELKLTNYWNTLQFPDDAFFFLDSKTASSFPLPDEIDTVAEITLK